MAAKQNKNSTNIHKIKMAASRYTRVFHGKCQCFCAKFTPSHSVILYFRMECNQKSIRQKSTGLTEEIEETCLAEVPHHVKSQVILRACKAQARGCDFCPHFASTGVHSYSTIRLQSEKTSYTMCLDSINANEQIISGAQGCEAKMGKIENAIQ